MAITLNGTTGITTDTGYSGDGVTFADGTPSNTLVTTTGGNVGIGTSSPALGFVVEKDNGSGYVAGFRSASGSPILTIQNTGGISQIQGLNSALSATANIALQVSGGNVGVGTTSPSSRLDVSGSGTNASALIQSTRSDLSITTAMGSDGGLSGGFIRTSTNHPLVFGTNNTERMRIDTSGRMTMPYQPSFRAWTQTDIANTGSGSVFQFPNVSSNGCFNNGGHYSTSTYRFTAPVAGKYFFSAHCIFRDYPINNSVEGTFRVNGGYSVYFDRQSKIIAGSSNNRFSLGGSAIINLSANDYVEVMVYADTASSWSYESSSNFSGFLMG